MNLGLCWSMADWYYFPVELWVGKVISVVCLEVRVFRIVCVQQSVVANHVDVMLTFQYSRDANEQLVLQNILEHGIVIEEYCEWRIIP